MDENNEKELENKQEQTENDFSNVEKSVQEHGENEALSVEEISQEKHDDEIVEAKIIEQEEIQQEAQNSNDKKESDLSLINILSLVFGIFSVLGMFLMRVGLTFITSVTAIILGYIGGKYPKKGLGRAGRICGIVSLVIVSIMFGIVLWFFSMFFGRVR